jgi:hypothetical protein
MFIRTKVIKGKEYAYVVKNKWTTKGARQKVSKYLGRQYTFSDPGPLEFSSFVGGEVTGYLKSTGYNDIIRDLVRWELSKHGFTEEKEGWKREQLALSAGATSIQEGRKNVVLKINEGFLSSYTIGRVRRFNQADDDPDEVGYGLAERLVLAGIAVPKEVFVVLYEKSGKH